MSEKKDLEKQRSDFTSALVEIESTLDNIKKYKDSIFSNLIYSDSSTSLSFLKFSVKEDESKSFIIELDREFLKYDVKSNFNNKAEISLSFIKDAGELDRFKHLMELILKSTDIVQNVYPEIIKKINEGNGLNKYLEEMSSHLASISNSLSQLKKKSKFSLE
jgi:hypothetical protein